MLPQLLCPHVVLAVEQFGDNAEQIQRSEVYRILKKMDLSPEEEEEEEEAIKNMSNSLVDNILHDLLCPLRLCGCANNKG